MVSLEVDFSEEIVYGYRSGCGHFRVEHELLESLVLDYLTQTAPQVKALLDATTTTDMEVARPLLEAVDAADASRRGVWLDMLAFVDEHWPGNKARRKTRMSIEELYDFLYERAKPQLEKRVAEKEAEIEAVLDGFAGLTPKMKDRVNKRLEALQIELDALRRDLTDSRVSWEYLRGLLVARQEALQRATAALNQGGHVRQKAEVLKTVVDKIVCHFRRVGKRTTLESIEVIPAEDAATGPLTFQGSLLKDSCLGAFA